jgi:hypothetical protein
MIPAWDARVWRGAGEYWTAVWSSYQFLGRQARSQVTKPSELSRLTEFILMQMNLIYTLTFYFFKI